MDAREARKLSESYNKEQIQSQIREIEELIDGATDCGNFSISTSGIRHETKLYFEELGYKVEQGTQYNEQWTSISW